MKPFNNTSELFELQYKNQSRREHFHDATMDEINALGTTLEAEQILDGCTATRDALAQCCNFFRQFGRLNPAISDQKTGTILGFDEKTVWTQETKFLKFGLENRRSG
jgi:hypothetical protein